MLLLLITLRTHLDLKNIHIRLKLKSYLKRLSLHLKTYTKTSEMGIGRLYLPKLQVISIELILPSSQIPELLYRTPVTVFRRKVL